MWVDMYLPHPSSPFPRFSWRLKSEWNSHARILTSIDPRSSWSRFWYNSPISNLTTGIFFKWHAWARGQISMPCHSIGDPYRCLSPCTRIPIHMCNIGLSTGSSEYTSEETNSPDDDGLSSTDVAIEWLTDRNRAYLSQSIRVKKTEWTIGTMYLSGAK